MKHSERLEQRNDIIAVIFQIDSELAALSGDKSFRAAQQAREQLETRHELGRELNRLGFQAPGLDERLDLESLSPGADRGTDRGSDVGGDSVVAKRRIGPAAETG